MSDLFRAHWPAVFGYIHRRTANRALAEDLAQETFVRATAAFLGWRGGSPLAWLLVIARNVVADHHRRGRPLVPLEEALPPAEEFPHTRLEVRDLLARLPEPDRRLLEMIYLDGFTHSEVAAMTSRTPAAIRTAVWRARESLRVLVREESGDE